MKIVVLHDKYSNEPIIVKVDAITMIRKIADITDENSIDEYANVFVNDYGFNVKENIATVMTKIKRAESEVGE